MQGMRQPKGRKAGQNSTKQTTGGAGRSSRWMLRRAIRRLLPTRIFAGLTRHGNTKWSFPVLTCVALIQAWSGETTLKDRFVLASDVASHWFPRQFVAGTYRGFMKALVRHGPTLLRIMAQELRSRMLQLEPGSRRVAGLIPFVVDGSKLAAPWTRANEARLGKKGRKPRGKKCQRKQTVLRPQLTVTLLWHMSLGLPWAWQHGGLSDGERTQFRNLLDELPRESLVVADAGFVGYALWQTIIRSGRHFLIRVGGNVELLQSLVPGCAVRHDGQTVWLWPGGKRQSGHPPLQLRLITLRRGKEKWYLVTSLLDRLTVDEARELYGKRWGVECCFRTLKQTFERAKLRSYTPACSGAELDWSLMSLWLLALMAKEELLTARTDPGCYSPAAAGRLLRRELRLQSAGRWQLDLAEFRTAVKDSYHRKSSRKSRHDQRKKRDPQPGAPKLIKASPELRRAAKAFVTSPVRAA